MPADLFDLSNLAPSALTRAALAAARPLLNRALGLAALRQRYDAMPEGTSDSFVDRALATLRITLDVSRESLARIPAAGPVIVVANHPHGALDGLALAAVVRQVRPDLKLLANYWLATIPALRTSCCFVDPFGGPHAAAHSRAGLREAHLWLRQGGVLLAFPAGAVAARISDTGQPEEGEWAATIGRLAAMTGASICPAFIAGRNSRLFYAAGRIHPAFRTALLARELLNKSGADVTVRIGSLVHHAAGDERTDGTHIVARARTATLALARTPDPISTPASTIPDELAALPASARLVSAGDFDVFCATAERLPAALQEIGRLREITYRAVGEGTGLDVDLDRFDLTYRHLVLWDHRTQRIVGAYRLGCVDQLLHAQGVDGLYTRTLFTYDAALLARLGPAIELGRSFIRTEYQRHHAVLLLLWRGICQFVARHPNYRVLFGPVSISARYDDATRAAMVTYLQSTHGDKGLASLVRAQHPPGFAVSDAEPSGHTRLPVLLRHYLKLGGRVLGFNLDPQFANALDALLYVKLDEVEPALLARYFGEVGAQQFLAGRTDAAAGVNAAGGRPGVGAGVGAGVDDRQVVTRAA